MLEFLMEIFIVTRKEERNMYNAKSSHLKSENERSRPERGGFLLALIYISVMEHLTTMETIKA